LSVVKEMVKVFLGLTNMRISPLGVYQVFMAGIGRVVLFELDEEDLELDDEDTELVKLLGLGMKDNYLLLEDEELLVAFEELVELAVLLVVLVLLVFNEALA
jgi:hypothetical protein